MSDKKRPLGFLNHLPRWESPRPLRFLARRVLQAMGAHVQNNYSLGERTAPGRYLAVRLLEHEEERERWEQEFAESRAAIEQEVTREAAARQWKLRAPVSIQLVALTGEQLQDPAVAERLASLSAENLLARLPEEGEIIVPLRARPFRFESVPPGAAVYVDRRQLASPTPCAADDLTPGRHRVRMALPGYLIAEQDFDVPSGASGDHSLTVQLQPEPAMGYVDVVTYPPGASVTVAGQTREAPFRLRVPAGEHEITAALEEYAPATAGVRVTPGNESGATRVSLRLQYAGPDKGEVAGRLIVYKPLPLDAAPPPRPAPTRIPGSPGLSDYLGGGQERDVFWDLPPAAPPTLEVLGERPLYKGVLIIGREDPEAPIVPDVKLFDPGNSVSRGCHAWLHVHADPGTGGEYNTFVLGCASPLGMLVNDEPVHGIVTLGDETDVQIGRFRMRIVKELPEARVEF